MCIISLFRILMQGMLRPVFLWQDVNILIFCCFPKPFDPDIVFSSTAAVPSSFISFPSGWPGTIDNEQHFSSLPYFLSDSTYLRTVKQYDDAIMAKNFFKSYIWLVDLLSRRGYISLREISNEWQKSPLNMEEDELNL